MTLRAQLYARLSTQTQADTGQSLNTQAARCLTECQQQRWQPVGMEFDDRHSGRGGERAGLYRALERIACGDADILVVADVDRLTRSVADWQALLRWFEEADADVFDVGLQQFICSGPGREIASAIVLGAEREAEKTAERTKTGMEHKRARGEVTGRPSVWDDPKIAARIHGLRAGGMSLKQICDVLNAEGVPTPRRGKEWRPSALQTVLGYVRPAATPKPLRLPPIPPWKRQQAA